MFTFKPAAKNGSNGNGNGQPNGNGHGSANGNGNGHSPQPEGNGNGKSGHSSLAKWFGLVARDGNGHNRTPERPAAARHSHGHSKKIDSTVGPGVSFRGTLTGTGSVRIEGSFDGTINIEGALVVADGAKVTAEVRAGSVTVGGSLKGNITAGRVEIHSTGRVWGDLVTAAFATEEGAFLRGQVRMEDEVQVAEAAEPEREIVPI
jgi:cytoskeletal protein CcmA (bactofilin family)